MPSELLQNIAEQYDKNLPFVVYRKPNTSIVQAVLQKDDAIYEVNDFTETGFIFAPFDSTERTVLIASDSIKSEKYIRDPQNIPNTKSDILRNSAQKEFHINLVKKGIDSIRKGEFKKVVLSRKVETECTSSPIELFQKLLDTYKHAFCYLWYHPSIGTWLGATPEILLKTENQQFTTMSLAGTKKYSGGTKLNWGNKELEEQQLVTDYIVDALHDTVEGLKIGERESTRAGNLWHLRTKLTGSIAKNDLAKIVEALHPTPAVCGMPLEATKKFILKNEGYNREFYTGFLGELNFKIAKDRTINTRNQENKAYRSIKNSTTLFVNLRCVQLKKTSAHIYIGGGVTQDSDPNLEWQETIAKSQTMLRIIS